MGRRSWVMGAQIGAGGEIRDRAEARLLGSILWFDPRREHSSVPTAKSRIHRAQGLSRLAASFAATRRAWP